MPSFVRGSLVYVDECKTRGYYVAAAVVQPHEVGVVDRALRKLTRAGQRRIHFARESDASRKVILAAVVALRVRVVVYQVKGASDKVARPLCLDALVDDIAAGGAVQLILERDDSVEVHDRHTIAAALRRNGHYELRYSHSTPSEHAVLWVSDIVAWCCYRGGDWLRRASPLILETRMLMA